MYHVSYWFTLVPVLLFPFFPFLGSFSLSFHVYALYAIATGNA